MHDELLTYFERELTYLRQLGADYAAKYPKIAARLQLEPERCADPHVERLIEAVAFLTARIRHKIDDELPEVSHALLGILYPHFLAPVPAFTTAQFHLDPSQGNLTGAYEIARHTELTAKPVRGVRCRFRTCSPVRLWPIEIADARLESPPGVQPLPAARAFRVESLLRLRIRSLGPPFAGLDLDTLRLFLHGESSLTAGLYELAGAGPCQVELHPAGGGSPILLPADAVRPAGFGRDDLALEYPKHAFRAYALLQEYFCFPERFLYLDLDGLARLAERPECTDVEVRIYSGRTPTFNQTVGTTTLRLGCTPVVNLFQRRAEPIRVDHTKVEYRVVPDVHAQSSHEVYAVDQVVCIGGEREAPVPLQALYALGHDTPATAQTFWHASRRQAIDGATEVYLSLTDEHLTPTTPAVETLSVTVTCTNRDLPAQLPFSGAVGADLDSETIAPFVRIECLRRPSDAARPLLTARTHWQLISHLALNYVSLVGDDPDALRGILRLYDFTRSAATRQQIEGLVGVSSQPVVRNVAGAFSRGLRVTLRFDRTHFVGTGVFLFASVLERFLALYASLNSFVELQAYLEGEEHPLHRWPARAGEQAIL